CIVVCLFFFFQAEDGIRDATVTGVQTCALPIFQKGVAAPPHLVGTLRNTVFTSQLGKVSDLADERIVEIVKLYSDLPVLLQIIEGLNRKSSELDKDDGSAQQAQRVRIVLSVVIAL